MRKNWLYYGIIAIITVTLLSFSLLKNKKSQISHITDEQLSDVLMQKIDSLYFDKQQVYLSAGITEKDITVAADEFERILIGRELVLGQIDSDEGQGSEWFDVKEQLATVQKKFMLQEQVNKLFLSQDYRNLPAEDATSKQAVTDADELFDPDAKAETTSSSQTEQTAESAAPKKETAPSKKTETLVALDGGVANSFLVIADAVTAEDFATIKKALTEETKADDWQKALLTSLDNGLEQLETIEAAQKLVAALYDGKEVKANISKEQYERALKKVETIYNSKRQQPLLDKMEKVAATIGEEFSQKNYLFEELTDRSAITLTAKQTNSQWQLAPLNFSVTIVNKSERNISFAYQRFVIQKPNKTLKAPDFKNHSETERFVVKKGEEYTLTNLPFKYPNETLVKSSQNSHLVYLFDKDDATDPNVLQLLSVTFTDQVTASSASPKSVSQERLKAVRKLLKDLNVDDASLTDEELETLISQASADHLSETDLLILICDYLGIDYQEMVKQTQAEKTSATTDDAN